MSDGDASISQAVLDQITDIGSETVKSVVKPLAPTNIAKHVVGQLIGNALTKEELAKKRANDMATTQRIHEIEADIAKIKAEKEKLTGPDIAKSETNTNEALSPQTQKPQDIALQRAKTKVEGDKANKG